MSDYIEISTKNILKESQTTASGFCDKKYVIYINTDDCRQKIRVNTYYRKKDDKIKLCTHYDRGLCDTIEEYENLDLHYIESQAYGSWMDGAR